MNLALKSYLEKSWRVCGGEWSPSVILRGIKYLNQDNIQAFRRTLGLNSCDWLCQWAINNPQAVIAWLNTQL
jgi:hypothetical protein